MSLKNHPLPIIISTLLLAVMCASCITQPPHVDPQPPPHDAKMIKLPEPDLQGLMTLEEALEKRRSVRNFQDTALSTSQVGQLLWAAQGITHPSGYRTAPSAGALYPLEIYAATRDGLFHYDPSAHSLVMIFESDPRPNLHQAALQQNSVLEAPLVIVIAADFSRTAQKYGDARTPQYVYLEAGHAAQNILLQAVALELGAVPIGAFYDDQLIEALSLPEGLAPLYLIPVGQPK